jgi:hypothetical protein
MRELVKIMNTATPINNMETNETFSPTAVEEAEYVVCVSTVQAGEKVTAEYPVSKSEFHAFLGQFSSATHSAVIFETLEKYVIGIPKALIISVQGGTADLYPDDDDADYTSIVKFPNKG